METKELVIKVSLDKEETSKKLAQMALIAGALENRIERLHERMDALNKKVAQHETSKGKRK